MNTASQLLNCIQCGRCSGGCPVSMKSNLNIRKALYWFLLTQGFPTDAERTGIWECTTCTTCNLRCPKSCEPLSFILDSRSNLVEKGRIEESIIKALESTFRHGNPFGKPREKRAEWQRKADIPVKILANGETAEYLLFVCCINAYDPRLQVVIRSLAKLLFSLGIDFGILGEEESCCGSEIRRMGETGLFSELKEMNIRAFQKQKIRKIITASPHCYNALKNEYGLSIPVYHWTSFIFERVEGLQDRVLKREEDGVFQDPCFLGKINKIYEAPRALLRMAVRELKEFDRSRERSLCCEGGGGRMWVESKGRGRLAEKRIAEAKELGVCEIYVACPFCLSTLEDAAKVLGEEENIKIKDIAELLVECLGS